MVSNSVRQPQTPGDVSKGSPEDYSRPQKRIQALMNTFETNQPVCIRVADQSEAGRIRDFYASEGRSPQVAAIERFVIAETGQRGQVIGVVRLCSEDGHFVL